MSPEATSNNDAWARLERLAADAAGTDLRARFAADPGRAERYVVDAAGWRLDYSKNHIDDEIRGALVALADASGLRDAIAAMFSGSEINFTERRPVLHVALRAPADRQIEVGGENVVPAVHEVLGRMASFVEDVRAQRIRGFTGEPIRDVVNIGIGGSDLGPAMAATALWPGPGAPIRTHFVSNVDGHDFARVVADLDPARTLFIVCSKTFTTQETLTNARTARAWLVARLGDEAAVAHHFTAVSTALDEVAAFGIGPERTFGFWSWVGGRYSLMSAVGLSVMMQIGSAGFAEMLLGAHAMDEHFRTTPPLENLPVLLALVGVWNVNLLHRDAIAILPYAQRLLRLPAYLQQLEMESNGKRTRRDGSQVEHATCPVVWGEPGTNGQHAFYQLLHQGTGVVPCDFIGFVNSSDGLDAHHDLLMANMFAQSAALAFGRTPDEVRAEGIPDAQVPPRTFPGDRPSNTLLADRLTPRSLGALIALYEHKVFVQGIVWEINSFDQWGVELGKQLANRIAQALAAQGEVGDHDTSTAGLIEFFRAQRAREEAD